jgi:hypothetical protein
MRRNKYCIIFIFLVVFPVIFFGKDFPLDISSIKYKSKIFIKNKTDEITIPIFVNFYNQEMKLFFFNDYPHIDWCLIHPILCNYFNRKLNRFYKIPEKNKLRLKKEKSFSYKVTTGFESIIIAAGGRKIKKKHRKSIEGKYIFSTNTKDYKPIKAKFYCPSWTDYYKKFFDYYEFIYPADYHFMIKFEDLKIDISQFRKKKTGRVDDFTLTLKNPYIEFETSIIDPLNKKIYKKLRLIALKEIVLPIQLIEREKKTPGEIVERIINRELYKKSKQYIELNGFFHEGPLFPYPPNYNEYVEGINRFKKKINGSYTRDFESNLDIRIAGDEYYNNDKDIHYNPHIVDIRIKGDLIIDRDKEKKKDFEMIFYNTGSVRNVPEAMRYNWFDIVSFYDQTNLIKEIRFKEKLGNFDINLFYFYPGYNWFMAFALTFSTKNEIDTYDLYIKYAICNLIRYEKDRMISVRYKIKNSKSFESFWEEIKLQDKWNSCLEVEK